MKKNILLYSALLIFGLVAPFLFPAFKLQISFLWILIILAMTWDVQGGQMGYNTFGINAALCGVAGACIAITFTLHPYVGLPYTVRSFMIVILAGLGNLPGVALSGMGLGIFEEFADYLLGTEFRIGAVFLLLVLILVYRRFKLSRKREYLK